ncbi:hypothetical protein LWF01_08130 [Saxibacter everestensis]|uniref:Acetone carboxylase n=1 Tax=Saxibacter everestensis TaxID=2909229 RepID=A0ABY8QXG8_9MICO|nr:hypothetical protein LWF01_08130 [Brevibacteriaceae bacterium ZFBP1038]
MSVFDLGRPSGGENEWESTPEPRCSRKACHQSASWGLLWNNPRIHTPVRRKVWLSCDEHRDWLQQYLTSRGLHKETLALADIPADAG